MVECTEPLTMMALHIPEENRSATKRHTNNPYPTNSDSCHQYRHTVILLFIYRIFDYICDRTPMKELCLIHSEVVRSVPVQAVL